MRWKSSSSPRICSHSWTQLRQMLCPPGPSTMPRGSSTGMPQKLHVPMFPGYIFVNVTPERRAELRCSRSVIRILELSESEEEVLIGELNLIRELETISEDEELEEELEKSEVNNHEI